MAARRQISLSIFGRCWLHSRPNIPRTFSVRTSRNALYRSFDLCPSRYFFPEPFDRDNCVAHSTNTETLKTETLRSFKTALRLFPRAIAQFCRRLRHNLPTEAQSKVATRRLPVKLHRSLNRTLHWNARVTLSSA